MTTQTPQIVLPSNAVDQKVILDAVKEADSCFYRIESERDQLKAIVETLVEKFPDIPKKHFNKMFKIYHKDNFQNQSNENDDFSLLYTTIIG